MDTTVLKQAGLTDAEARVYLALLDLGSAKIGALVKKSKVAQSKIYDVLSRLLEKGLASYIFHGKIKVYAPADPERLLSYLGEQQERLQETSAAIQQIIPSLKHQLQENQSEYRAEIFEGLRGIRNFFDLSKQDLRKGDVLYTLGYNSMASQLFSGYFKEYHAWKDKQKIYSKVIFTYDAWFGKKREKRKYAEQRYLPKGVSPPGFMHFFKDWVGLIILTEKQKLCIAVKNQELADSYVQYFNLLWKQSVPGK